jgi:hypothetical protein
MRKLAKAILVLLSLGLNAVFASDNTHSANRQSDRTTLMLVEIYTNGSSTPKIGNPFSRGFIKTHGSKALTEFGMRQQLNLGADVRIAHSSLIHEIHDLDHIRVYSSGSRASVLSAISHNIGLFRKKHRRQIERIYERSRIQPRWHAAESNKFKAPLTSFQK